MSILRDVKFLLIWNDQIKINLKNVVSCYHSLVAV
jgi:hypothetical protein